MPFESEAQRKAMYAAASGRSNIGIPKEVAKKFIKHSEDGDIPEESTPLSTPEFKEDDADPCWEGYKQLGMKQKGGKEVPNCVPEDDSEAWQTKEGKNKNGGLNAKGRASYNKEHGAHLKAPQPKGGSRKESFCARMSGMKEKLTSDKTKHDPNSRINLALKKWKCDADWDSSKVQSELKGLSAKLAEITQSITNLKADDLAVERIATGSKSDAMPIDKDAGALGRAAGIMFLTNDGKVLLIRRGDGGDYPQTWAVPGGHQNKGETLEDCARRECFEETGIKYDGKLEVLFDDGQFRTYIAKNVEQQKVRLNDESTGYDWAHIDNPPMPLHPGQDICFKIASAKTEFDYAELIRQDLLPSPQMYANVMLLAIRITGTGLAYRSSIGEHVWRDSSLYLNDDFLKRCNGLIVIMDHPETAVLTSKEFKDRAVGSIILPYIKGDEVWGIAKIYDQDAVNTILTEEVSTSPSVVFDQTAGNTTLTTENGEPLLIEGVPFLLDHIAIVTEARGSKGVWDKGGEPAGVLLTNQEVSEMTDNKVEPKADAQGDKLDAILSALSSMSVRIDEMEKNLPAPPLVTAADKKRKDEDAKMDDDDEESESEAKHFMERKMDSKKRKDEDMEEKHMESKKMRKDDDEDDMKKAKKDAEGSDMGEEKMPSGEMKPDDDDAKKDEEAMKMDEAAAEYADAQAKCDSVLAAFGKSASRPLQGESLMAYRKRLLRGLQAYSDSYKDINLATIKDAKLLELAEKQIMNDAMTAARTSSHVPGDQLIAIQSRDSSGRTITKYRGSMEAWLGDFKVPPQRATTFHTSNNQR